MFMRHFFSYRTAFGFYFLAVPAVLLTALLTIFHGAAAVGAVPDQRKDDAARFLSSYGWQVDADACEAAEVRLPERFNAVYERYNELQRAQGFDLTPYRGRTAWRFRFPILGDAGADGGRLYANVLFCDDEIIAADVCSTALDGSMRGVR